MVQTRSQSLSQNNQINMALPTGTGDSRDQDEVHSACEDQSVVAESVHVGDREAGIRQSPDHDMGYPRTKMNFGIH